jgi:hypothetical protein
MVQLSQNASAVLTLLHAQNHVSQRFDYSWWVLDAAKWELVAKLNGAEHGFILAIINRNSARMRERAAA